MGTNGAHTPAVTPENSARATGWQHIESANRGTRERDAAVTRRQASSLQSEASRRNGSKSRGPKTTEGKNRSRANAIKHGLRAETLLLEIGTEEENAAFESLRSRLEVQFAARTIEEQLLLESVVLALWQKKRGLQFEARELRQELVFHGPVMDRILRYATAADKRLFRALAQLKQLQQNTNSGPNGEEAEQGWKKL